MAQQINVHTTIDFEIEDQQLISISKDVHDELFSHNFDTFCLACDKIVSLSGKIECVCSLVRLKVIVPLIALSENYCSGDYYDSDDSDSDSNNDATWNGNNIVRLCAFQALESLVLSSLKYMSVVEACQHDDLLYDNKNIFNQVSVNKCMRMLSQLACYIGEIPPPLKSWSTTASSTSASVLQHTSHSFWNTRKIRIIYISPPTKKKYLTIFEFEEEIYEDAANEISRIESKRQKIQNERAAATTTITSLPVADGSVSSQLIKSIPKPTHRFRRILFSTPFLDFAETEANVMRSISSNICFTKLENISSITAPPPPVAVVEEEKMECVSWHCITMFDIIKQILVPFIAEDEEEEDPYYSTCIDKEEGSTITTSLSNNDKTTSSTTSSSSSSLSFLFLGLGGGVVPQCLLEFLCDTLLLKECYISSEKNQPEQEYDQRLVSAYSSDEKTTSLIQRSKEEVISSRKKPIRMFNITVVENDEEMIESAYKFGFLHNTTKRHDITKADYCDVKLLIERDNKLFNNHHVINEKKKRKEKEEYGCQYYVNTKVILSDALHYLRTATVSTVSSVLDHNGYSSNDSDSFVIVCDLFTSGDINTFVGDGGGHGGGDDSVDEGTKTSIEIGSSERCCHEISSKYSQSMYTFLDSMDIFVLNHFASHRKKKHDQSKHRNLSHAHDCKYWIFINCPSHDSAANLVEYMCTPRSSSSASSSSSLPTKTVTYDHIDILSQTSDKFHYHSGKKSTAAGSTTTAAATAATGINAIEPEENALVFAHIMHEYSHVPI